MSPRVWKQFAHSLCLQCFVFRMICPLVTKDPLPSVNSKDSSNLNQHFFQETPVAAACFFILRCVMYFWCHRCVKDAVPSGWACSACRSGLPTFSSHIVNSTSAFHAIIMTDGSERWWPENNNLPSSKARSVLINGRTVCKEPPLRHLLRWADELQ